jgi:hypothetical protein
LIDFAEETPIRALNTHQLLSHLSLVRSFSRAPPSSLCILRRTYRFFRQKPLVRLGSLRAYPFARLSHICLLCAAPLASLSCAQLLSGTTLLALHLAPDIPPFFGRSFWCALALCAPLTPKWDAQRVANLRCKRELSLSLSHLTLSRAASLLSRHLAPDVLHFLTEASFVGAPRLCARHAHHNGAKHNLRAPRTPQWGKTQSARATHTTMEGVGKQQHKHRVFTRSLSLLFRADRRYEPFCAFRSRSGPPVVSGRGPSRR